MADGATPQLEEMLSRIAAAPRGPKVAAVFDYDGTVITGSSAAAFWGQRLRRREAGLGELVRMGRAGLLGVASAEEYADQLEAALSGCAGQTPDEVAERGRALFKHEIAAGLHTEVWELIEAHHARGHTVLLTSSATRYQAEPMAREIGAEHVLYTELEVRDGRLTGHVAGPPLWGLAKARAVRAVGAAHDLALASSFGYAHGEADLMLLESVGHPAVVTSGPAEAGAAPTGAGALVAEAGRRGWPVLACVPRGRPPGVTDVLRTAGFYGGFFTAIGAGTGIGLLRRSKRDMLDVTFSLGADLSLGLSGVRVNVVSGAEHIEAARPAVYVFNHQSKLDPIIATKLVRERFTGVAKKEARSMPVFGQLFQLADVAFVDRGDTTRAIRAIEPAVAKVRDEGVSLLIAPEGTRSATPRLGRFKKGAFHIAMQAGVPMVPVVIRNAGEVMWRGSQAIRAGTVDVVVHPPVDTSGWRPETIDEHVAEVRGTFVDTLAHWPGRAAPVDDPGDADPDGER